MQIAGLRGSQDPGGREGRWNSMTVDWGSSCAYFESEISDTCMRLFGV